jgi:hypothetical protein
LASWGKRLETVLKTTEGVEVGTRKKLNPTVTLTGLEAGWTKEEIVEEVFQKNEWIRNTGTKEEFERDFKFKRCQKSPKENLTFAVEPRLHKALIERQKIVVVFVEEMVQVTRCYNCTSPEAANRSRNATNEAEKDTRSKNAGTASRQDTERKTGNVPR